MTVGAHLFQRLKRKLGELGEHTNCSYIRKAWASPVEALCCKPDISKNMKTFTPPICCHYKKTKAKINLESFRMSSTSAGAIIADLTNALRAIPNIPASKAILHVGSSSYISASSRDVWKVLIDTAIWLFWSPFIPRVTIRSQPDAKACKPLSRVFQKGTAFTLHLGVGPIIRSQQVTLDVHFVVTEFTAPNLGSAAPGCIVWAVDYDKFWFMPRSMFVG